MIIKKNYKIDFCDKHLKRGFDTYINMKLRFEQPNTKQCTQPVPKWVPPAWQIPLIDKGNRKPEVDNRERAVVYDEPPPGWKPTERTPTEEPERGVVILQL